MRLINLFINVLKNEYKAFIFWTVIFTIFRLAFILCFANITSLDLKEFWQALYLGVRISFKTTGFICLTSGILCLVLNFISQKLTIDKVQRWWHDLCLAIFAFGFCARIPYYKQFNNAFDIMLINGMHDDKKAILDTAITQYQLLPRLIGWAVITCILVYAFKKYQAKFIKVDESDGQLPISKVRVVAHVIFLAIFAVFCRYGGAFDYGHSVYWENAARLKSHLLNEAILDDGQALYRVASMHKRMKNVAKVKFTAAELENKLTLIGCKPIEHSINKSMMKVSEQPLALKQPQQVVVVIGESFGIWPFTEEFEELHLVDNTKAIINSNNAISVNTMLAHGNGTIATMNGFFTGLPNTGIYVNYDKRMLAEPQPTALAYYMKQLGYKTVFWYGGVSEWQNIKNIALAQSFDETHFVDEFAYTGGTTWGCPDGVLYQGINKYMENHKNEKVFHMLLTVTNHPPYILDVAKEGFPMDDVEKKLPASCSKNKATLMELGHMWYADKTMGDFIRTSQKIVPETLFVITGDHSERFDFAKEQTNYVRSGMPCVFYGNMIDKSVINDIAVGSHGEIAPTLMQLIAPKGTVYSSFYEGMFTKRQYTNNFAYVAYSDAKNNELLPINQAPEDVQKRIDAVRDVAAWRIVKGDKF